jgi:hypothetical protein
MKNRFHNQQNMARQILPDDTLPTEELTLVIMRIKKGDK